MSKKPIKKTDQELFTLIEDKITQKKYAFRPHARQRIIERNISELDVIYLLSGRHGYGRKRNKTKDTFESVSIYEKAQDWKYCIEGNDIDRHPLRIIVTFEEDWMPIITVIRIGGVS